jgi:hypothetical protein
MKRLTVAVGIAILIGLSVNGMGLLGYTRGWIDIDVSDRHGGGPDRGPEWDGAARSHISRAAILTGLLSCPLAMLALTTRRKRKCEQDVRQVSSEGAPSDEPST